MKYPTIRKTVTLTPSHQLMRTTRKLIYQKIPHPSALFRRDNNRSYSYRPWLSRRWPVSLFARYNPAGSNSMYWLTWRPERRTWTNACPRHDTGSPQRGFHKNALALPTFEVRQFAYVNKLLCAVLTSEAGKVTWRPQIEVVARESCPCAIVTVLGYTLKILEEKIEDKISIVRATGAHRLDKDKILNNDKTNIPEGLHFTHNVETTQADNNCYVAS